MQFQYEGFCINILDTPGHQDFSEDTYRTLMAADSAVMVIDAAKGIEPQTRKLFRICAMTPEDALLKLKLEPFEDLGFAKVDHHRELRQGTSEVLYGAGKTDEHIIRIAQALRAHGQKTVLVTRIAPATAAAIAQAGLPIDYNESGRIGVIGAPPEPDGDGTVVVATGGTSDIPVAEEAAVTAEALGNRVKRLYDVGVSGVHRLLSHAEDIMDRVLTYAKDYLAGNTQFEEWSYKKDGASLISRMLFETATDVNLFIGKAVNPAHQNLPFNFEVKMRLVNELVDSLESMWSRWRSSSTTSATR